MTLPLGFPLRFGFSGLGGATTGLGQLPKVPVLIEFESSTHSKAFRGGTASRVGRVVSAFVGADGLAALAATPGVRRVELRQPHRLHLDVNTAKNGAQAARQATGLSGAGVLVGLIDTGIDITHADLRNADGSTRVVAIWDEIDNSFALSGGAVGSAPPVRDDAGQPIGTVYTQQQIDAALQGGPAVNSLDLVGHGTHVAACAASNGRAPGAYTGVAPDADLIMVRAGGATKQDFTFSGDIISALQWIDEQAAARHQSVVVNMSFGQHFGAHDDTSAEEVAIDDFVSSPGHIVSVSAGNERDVAIHSSGSTRGGRTLASEVTATTADLFAVDCWIPGSDIVDLAFVDPTGSGVSRANIPVGQCVVLEDQIERVSLCVDFVNPVNGDREVFAIVEPIAASGQIT
ncbi:MAG TPA: S8 family serine peptidase, partial [Candidatus Kryptonia bacterium]|nr:S8 family serine peptidase [Candidatus Kryptonia bacterium]